MNLLRFLFRRSRDVSSHAPTPPDAERAVERLSENEVLRADLTDAGYGPLLEVVSNLAVQRAARFDSTDALYIALRRLLTGAVDAAQGSTAEAFLEVATAPLLDADEHAALAKEIAPLHGSPDELAAKLAQVLAQVVGLSGSV